MPERVATFLDSIWRRFGHHSVDHLNKLCCENAAYRKARARDPRAEIPLDAMRAAFDRARTAPGADKVVRPRTLRASDGRPVTVRNWAETLKSAGGQVKK